METNVARLVVEHVKACVIARLKAQTNVFAHDEGSMWGDARFSVRNGDGFEGAIGDVVDGYISLEIDRLPSPLFALLWSASPLGEVLVEETMELLKDPEANSEEDLLREAYDSASDLIREEVYLQAEKENAEEDEQEDTAEEE